MSAKSYKKKFVEPLINRLKNLVRTVLARSYKGWENYHRINNLNGRLYRENEHLKYENSKLKELNGMLREQNKAYRLLERFSESTSSMRLSSRREDLKSQNSVTHANIL